MDRSVREGILRLMPPDEKIDFFFTLSLLAGVCVYLVNEVKTVGETYGILQLLRVLAIAHVLRFVQSGIYKVPPEYYLQNVLKYYDLPITATISAFYIIFLIFPSPPNVILFLALFLLYRMILAYRTPMELEQDESPTQGPSSNTDQQNPIDIKVTDHFASILLAVICVDLAAELEKMKGTCYVFSMVFVLVSRHMTYICRPELREDNVPLAFYLRKFLQYYELPSIAAINGIYIIFIPLSKTLHLVLFMELTLLAILIYKREEPEQGTNPTPLASSLNTNSLSVHQQSRDVANSGDGGIPSVHNANPISGTNNFSGWEKGERIGAGGFGTVFKAHNREIGECAVKVLNIGPNNEGIRQEAGIISELKHHQNIVKYYGHNIDEQGHICLYMEYIKQGSLHDYVLKHGKLDEPFIRNFTTQILSGLFHLHRNKIVHRDIKPENLLVHYDNTVKLVDFGLAKVLAESKGKHSVWGTPYYAAPELLHNQIYESSSEAYKADIWSLGCVVIYMFTQNHPSTESGKQHPCIPKSLSKQGKDFLKLCFKEKPADRPSAKKLLEDPFVIAQNGTSRKRRRIIRF